MNPKRPLSRLFLCEPFILGLIVINAAVIYMQMSGCAWSWLMWVDVVCTLLFLVEMVVKQASYGIRAYWSDGWNRMDGILVILSLPSLIAPFVELTAGFHLVLALRLLRVMKSFRVMHFFPNFGQMIQGFRLAMQQTWAVLASFAVIIFILGLINCALFKELAPDYFATPLESIYSVFRLFTVEGWYEIPDTIAAASTPAIGGWVRFYFCLLLIAGGIIGMSFINSIFVDAMVADNNDDVKAQLDEINKQLAELKKMLEEKENN